MKTTFEEFISDPKRKEGFEEEYNEFLLSEFILEKMENEKELAMKYRQDYLNRRQK